jgi:hypothetical protein
MPAPRNGADLARPVIVAAVGTADLNGTPEARTARLLRWQADACRELGSPLYGDLLLHAADDLLAGGPTADVLRGHLDDRLASVLALRLLGGAHAVALSGHAPDLAAFYPSAGGAADPEPGSPRAWAALRQTLAEHAAVIRTWLDHPPQTNEVGRAAALLGGLRHIAAEASLPMRLVEVGASAGLNLRADRFYVPGDAGTYGTPDSPVVLSGGWLGDAPPESRIEVIERVGGDLSPVDPTTPAGQLTLTAYVWPDQVDRLSRLRGAFTIAEQVPAELRAESASTTLAHTDLVPGTWTSATSSGRSSRAASLPWVPRRPDKPGLPTCTWSSRGPAAAPSPWSPGRADSAASSGPRRRTGCPFAGDRRPDGVMPAAGLMG